MPVLRAFKSVKRALRAFFSHDISLRRRGKGVALVLQSRSEPAGAQRKSPGDAVAQRERDDLRLMLRQLSAVLSELQDTRRRCHHLVFVEHALDKKGMRALHKLPLDVLRPALEQLEALVTNWAPVGLANLRSKMAVAIIDREHMDPLAEADAYNTSMPLETPEPVAPVRAVVGDSVGEVSAADSRALAAAYAGLGTVRTVGTVGTGGTGGPAAVTVQGELASPSAKVASRAAGRVPGSLPEIKLRELQG